MQRFKRIFCFIFDISAIIVSLFFVYTFLGIALMFIENPDNITNIMNTYFLPILIGVGVLLIVVRNEIFKKRSLAQLMTSCKFVCEKRRFVILKNIIDILILPISLIFLLIKGKTVTDMLFNIEFEDSSSEEKKKIQLPLMIFWLCIFCFFIIMLTIRLSSNKKVLERYEAIKDCDIKLFYNFPNYYGYEYFDLTDDEEELIKNRYSMTDFNYTDESFYDYNVLNPYKIEICDELITIGDDGLLGIDGTLVKNTSFYDRIHEFVVKKSESVDRVFANTFCSTCGVYATDIPISAETKVEIRKLWKDNDKTLYEFDLDDMIWSYGITVDDEYIEFDLVSPYAKYKDTDKYVKLSDEFQQYLSNLFKEDSEKLNPDDNKECCSCCPNLKPGESCIASCCPCS